MLKKKKRYSAPKKPNPTNKNKKTKKKFVSNTKKKKTTNKNTHLNGSLEVNTRLLLAGGKQQEGTLGLTSLGVQRVSVCQHMCNCSQHLSQEALSGQCNMVERVQPLESPDLQHAIFFSPPTQPPRQCHIFLASFYGSTLFQSINFHII